MITITYTVFIYIYYIKSPICHICSVYKLYLLSTRILRDENRFLHNLLDLKFNHFEIGATLNIMSHRCFVKSLFLKGCSHTQGSNRFLHNLLGLKFNHIETGATPNLVSHKCLSNDYFSKDVQHLEFYRKLCSIHGLLWRLDPWCVIMLA